MSNFWSNKIFGGETTVSSPTPVSRELYGVYTPQQVQPQAVPAQQGTYTPRARLIEGSTCPGCGSTNYRGSVGSYAIACPECGYHPRFEQSGYGLPSLATSPGEATPARQPENTQTVQSAIAELNAGGGLRI